MSQHDVGVTGGYIAAFTLSPLINKIVKRMHLRVYTVSFILKDLVWVTILNNGDRNDLKWGQSLKIKGVMGLGRQIHKHFLYFRGDLVMFIRI